MTKMPHRRTPQADQRREAERILKRAATKDLLNKETINVITPGQLAVVLTRRLGTFDVDVINSFERGEVLEDQYSRGTLQRGD